MRNNFLTLLDCNSKDFVESYNKIFNSDWYPDLFVRDSYEVFYINTSDFLVDFIAYIVSNSDDNNVYLKVKNFNEICGYSCYGFSKDKIPLMESNLIYETALYTLDKGFLIFGDSSKWAFYVGEDLYDYGMKANYEDFSFVFISFQMKELILDFFKNMDLNSNSIEVREEFKKKYFQTSNSEGKITTILFHKL